MRNKTLLSAFALANPVQLKIFNDQAKTTDPQSADDYKKTVLGYVNREPILSHWQGDNPPAAQAIDHLYPDNPALKKRREQVYHVIPVWVPELATGMMVPISMVPSGDWSGTSLFSTFFSYDREDPLITLLKKIEQRWSVLNSGRQLPLRWRNVFSFQICCPIHLKSIVGKSLQVPLILMLLRGICATSDRLEKMGSLPLGNNPVFATGSLSLKDGNTFAPVYHVTDKAEAFIREYGEGLPAVLTKEQINELKDAGIIEQFGKVIEADNLDELLSHQVFKGGLERLAGPPHTTEIDNLLKIMADSARGVRFDDVEAMTTWLLPHVNSPVYRFRLRRQAASVLGHMGRFVDMKPHLEECRELLDNDKKNEFFGLTDRCDLTTTMVILAEDMMEPESALDILDTLKKNIGELPIEKRVSWWGSRCQVLRFQGKLDQAIEAGRQAVRLADTGRAGDSGRDRNYLVHALIDRIRTSNDQERMADDLHEAESLLKEAQTTWAPRDSQAARRSHLTFCLHYQAELARLKKTPFDPPSNPPWRGHWGHPWLFALLSCARNQAHSLEKRCAFSDHLVREVGKKAHPSSLFFMFLQTYRIYHAALNETDATDPEQELRRWCNNLADKGFSGWQDQLIPVLDRTTSDRLSRAESLCDAIHYH